MWAWEGDVLPEILVVPVDDSEGAPEHIERALHRHPMIGVEFLIVGVAMMGKMHVAEGFVLMQEYRAADIAHQVIEPQHL